MLSELDLKLLWKELDEYEIEVVLIFNFQKRADRNPLISDMIFVIS